MRKSMRKKLLLVALAVVMVGTTGCVETVELDEEQEDKLVQYAVYSVLEHDKNYLVNLEQIKEPEYVEIPEIPTDPSTEEPTKAPEDDTSGVQSGDNSKENTGTQNVENIAAAMDIEGVTLAYKGMKVCDSFPESDGTPVFVIKAVQGKKLVVLNFDMTNTTGADINIDVSSKKISVKGIFNNAIKTNALLTLLPEALNTYVGTVPAGGTVSTVLVFEMSDGYVNNLSEIAIDVKSDSGSKSIKIQ